jgi:hypothetical protein
MDHGNVEWVMGIGWKFVRDWFKDLKRFYNLVPP